MPSSPTPSRLSPEAFSDAYRSAYASLLLVARAQGAGSDADDVVQKAAMVAIDRLDHFEVGTNFNAWMSAIVRGVARNHRRGEKRAAERVLRFASADTIDRDPYTDPEPGAGPRVSPPGGGGAPAIEFPPGFREDLRNAVESLEPIRGACLVLKAVHGHSYDEIAAMLDVAPATARSHVFRARAALAASLGGPDGPDGPGGHASKEGGSDE